MVDEADLDAAEAADLPTGCGHLLDEEVFRGADGFVLVAERLEEADELVLVFAKDRGVSRAEALGVCRGRGLVLVFGVQ
jgi:hypothetical protein